MQDFLVSLVRQAASLELSSIVLAVATLAASLLTFLVAFVRLRPRRRRRLPPRPFTLPIIGTVCVVREWLRPKTLLLRERNRLLYSLAEQYGPIFRLKLGIYEQVWVTSREAYREALLRTSTHAIFSGRFLYHNQLAQNKHRRGLRDGDGSAAYLQFRHKVLATHLGQLMSGSGNQSSFEREVLSQYEKLRAALSTAASDEIGSLLTSSCANILCSLLFGTKHDELNDVELQQIIELVQKYFTALEHTSISTAFPLVEHFAPHSIRIHYETFDDCCRLLQHIVMEKIYDRTHSQRKTAVDVAKNSEIFTSFLDGFVNDRLKNNVSSSDEVSSLTDIEYTLIDLLLNGIMSLSLTLQWCVFLLIRYPEWQTKILNQILISVESGFVKIDDQKRCFFTDAFIDEVWRYATIVPTAAPIVTLADTKLMGFDIPRGTTVMFPLWSGLAIDRFNPMRFVNEKDDSGRISPKSTTTDVQHTPLLDSRRHDSMAFCSGTPRACPGESLARQVVFLMLANLVQDFQFSSCRTPSEEAQKKEVKVETPKVESDVWDTTMNGLFVRPPNCNVKVEARHATY